MKKNKIIFAILVISLLCAFLASFTACKKDDEPVSDSMKVYAETFRGIPTSSGTVEWQEGMVGGNGKTGFITSGEPYDDVIIYQNIDLILPTNRGRDDIEDTTYELEDVRQAIVNRDYYEPSSTSWDYSYKYHPGHFLRLTQEKLDTKSYKRWTDYNSGEVGVTYTDSKGEWNRSTFTSRVDNVTITKISQSSSGSKINMTISLDDLKTQAQFGKNENPNEKDMIYKEQVSSDASYLAFVVKYPDYENSNLQNGGYVGLTYVVIDGGTKEAVKEDSSDKYSRGDDCSIKIKNANNVYLISTVERTDSMCTFSNFAAQEDFTLVNTLKQACETVVNKYNDGGFSYSKALAPSKKIHSELFKSASVSFGPSDNASRYLTNEELLDEQRNSKTLSAATLERVYNQGRYAMICCAGYTMSRLCGLWTGSWSAAWRYIYTMDANVNLQASGMNTTNLSTFGDGYINFVYKQMADWETNATKHYGMTNAIQAPVNTDGDRALNAEYHVSYPFEYWNAGASWMIQPIYEYYECYGNKTITTSDGDKDLLSEILLPLLTKNANFWLQLCTPKYYTDANGNARYSATKTSLSNGEKYLIIPSYSPENYELTDTYALCVNSAMDISAANYALEMAVDVENLTKTSGYQERIASYENLINNLPNYTYDETGAIKEWCANGFVDDNSHRHISHLYCAWPAFEVEGNEALAAAVKRALVNRDEEAVASEATQSHGWLHRALVYARLGDSNGVNDCLYALLHSQLQYTSFMTDHNTNRKSQAYCTDSAFGLIGIIDEMLLYSTQETIEVLPACPSTLNQGSFTNLRARCRANVSCKWNNNKASVTIKSDVAQTIKVKYGSQTKEVKFNAGETKSIDF